MKEREDDFDMSMSSAELRKIRKPLIERKRRERINESLEQLKALLLQAYNRHDPQYTKMEKADILEMAVEHLQFLRASQITRPPSAFELAQKYSAGFRECVAEVTRCLGSFPDVSTDLKHRLMRHMNTYVDTMTACNGLLATQGLANQGRGYILPTNQRQDYNANLVANHHAQFSPPIASTQGNKNHVIRVPKPIKLEPVPFDINMIRTPSFIGPANQCCLGDLKTIESTRVRSDHIESPEEGAATASASSSAQSSAETERSRTSLVSNEQNETPGVSRKLEFEESGTEEDGEKEGDRKEGGEEQEQARVEEVNAANDANNNAHNVVNANHSDEEEEDDDMWRPW